MLRWILAIFITSMFYPNFKFWKAWCTPKLRNYSEPVSIFLWWIEICGVREKWYAFITGKKVLWVISEAWSWVPWSCLSTSWSPSDGREEWRCYITTWKISQRLGWWFSPCEASSSVCCSEYATRCFITLSSCTKVIYDSKTRSCLIILFVSITSVEM